MHQDLPRTQFARQAPAIGSAEADIYVIKLYTHRNETLFGTVVDGVCELNAMGQVVADEWVHLGLTRRDIRLDDLVVMPSYILGIVLLPTPWPEVARSSPWLAPSSTKPRALSSFIAGFKAAAAKRINLIRSQPGDIVWQRSYGDLLITDPSALLQVRQFLRAPALHEAELARLFPKSYPILPTSLEVD